MSAVRVEVTQEHIDKYAADINDSCGCPIFHALEDAGLKPRFVYVHSVEFVGVAEGVFFSFPPGHPAIEFQRSGMSAREWAYESSSIGNLLVSRHDPDAVATKVKAVLKPFSFELPA